jgi:hypothetical protein
MRPTLVRCLTTLVLLAIACSNPNEVCGCSIPPPSVIVSGRVLTANDAPVVGALVFADGVPMEMSAEPPMNAPEHTVTDATGAFSVRAVSLYLSGTPEMALRVGVVRSGTKDTVRFRPGAARFVTGSTPPPVTVTLRLP